ncbi:PD-(D/E)XK nuclease superfamily protein [Candidatus Methylomirabilis lanthanidiphila]|uniref:PD-(D/E)XK nuclease superfamily protein n=1 Tax=Candidatus Methylomirabilis lanthanidiphila TaxID=2211376 RepID=A0A564ZID2_9BACT|nr:PD-(D/E)XK nuclease family protein [Candidatus Methylomirabilis lanthanidiphila]VUZ85065.1 PD-(D/E)XK nuclease superfamily protein [Candidatus Methylomirabilis lanthanidiphila]
MPESGDTPIRRQSVRPVYSASRLSTYESCPLQFRYRYIDRIPRTEESIEAYLGSRVHEALSVLYHTVQRGGGPSLSDLLKDYHRQWGECWHNQVKIVKQDRSIDHYKEFGERCLVNYYQAHQPFNHGEVLGLECQVATSLDPDGCYKIQGYIDRLVCVGSGRYEIHDYKTSGRLPSQGDLDVDRQLALYQLAVEERWPDAKEIDLVWHYLAFGRELRSKRSPKALDGLKRSTIAVIDRIEADTEFTPIKSRLCHWCVYQNICPLWTDHSDATGTAYAPAVGDGRSMEVRTSVDRREPDIQSIARDALREAITLAAEPEGAEIRFGEHGQLWISMSHSDRKTHLNSAADGWVRLSVESLPLLFRQMELARLSAPFVEKLQRYLALSSQEDWYGGH